MLKEFILGILLNGVRVPKDLIVEHINDMDIDKDGCLSLMELISYVQGKLR